MSNLGFTDFHMSILVHICDSLGGIICIARPDISLNCSPYKVSALSNSNKDNKWCSDFQKVERHKELFDAIHTSALKILSKLCKSIMNLTYFLLYDSKMWKTVFHKILLIYKIFWEN